MEIPTNRPIAREDRDDKIYKPNGKSTMRWLMSGGTFPRRRPVLIGTTVEIPNCWAGCWPCATSITMYPMPNCTKGSRHRGWKREKRRCDHCHQHGRSWNRHQAFDEVKKAGGLAIVGAERHDSRRVDRQLRGRSGRQETREVPSLRIAGR